MSGSARLVAPAIGLARRSKDFIQVSLPGEQASCANRRMTNKEAVRAPRAPYGGKAARGRKPHPSRGLEPPRECCTSR